MSQQSIHSPQEPETPPNFWEMIAPHVKELRMRLLWALVGVVVGVAISFNLTNFFLDLLTQPIGGLDKLLSIEVTENLSVYMRVSLLGCCINCWLSSPRGFIPKNGAGFSSPSRLPP
jgi:Sec-independent protein secretion pathway component TatC